MTADFFWTDPLAVDVRFGYLAGDISAPRQRHPEVVLNTGDGSVLRTLREELGRCSAFTFSVAFVSTRAIALLKQELVDFQGEGTIITSDYLAFNSPQAFAELHNLGNLGVDIRIHNATAFHPKGYIFEYQDGVTAMMGSSNLTHNALVQNHEWNLKVSAAHDSNLAIQIRTLLKRELAESTTLTQRWIDEYAAGYVTPPPRVLPAHSPPELLGPASVRILANRMQRDALQSIADVRAQGHTRAIVISATGTGKTILSALDVRAFNPERMLFIVHREQILDRTIDEYQRVLDRPTADFGKLSGTTKQSDRTYVFATIQTLSQPSVLESFAPGAFDYVIIDEAHRAGAETYRRVMGHLEPKFLLGMTATPERTDGFNVFELFDYNVPYEIRLNHALEEDMLAPFHYYGVSEITYDDGRTVTDETELSVLISPERVDHLIDALEIYGQAGVPPRGLIFCARTKEALALSEKLNHRELRGRRLRTVALTGADPISRREAMVDLLERGELDYILTVDVFNEGVDIPTINQVVMLRQTQSAIVFVQQLGRGLRKAETKDYLVVIDFIGAYANNFMIPIALFGDDSLNKESLRKNMIASEEKGVLPGLSSVRFDKISQERVLQAIADTKLDNMQRIKAAMLAMRNRVGGVPALWDFLRFESVDPVLLATTRENYPMLVQAILKIDTGLSSAENRALGLLSHEILPAKRLHEFVLLAALLDGKAITPDEIATLFVTHGVPAISRHVESAIDTFTLEHHSEADQRRYQVGVVQRKADDGTVALTSDFATAYSSNPALRAAVDDLLMTGQELIAERYDPAVPFTPGLQYSRKETCRLLGWPRKWTSTIYGYRTDTATGMCPIFVTLHKSHEVGASTAYEDELIDRTTMRWYTRSRRTLASTEVSAIVNNDVEIHVFVKKDDAEGTDFYYLGPAHANSAEQTTMPGANGESLDVVRMLLRFDQPIDMALYDYFHPTVTT
jgi:superfamily II DNA or RNA helicase/HKD family nuclease